MYMQKEGAPIARRGERQCGGEIPQAITSVTPAEFMNAETRKIGSRKHRVSWCKYMKH